MPEKPNKLARRTLADAVQKAALRASDQPRTHELTFPLPKRTIDDLSPEELSAVLDLFMERVLIPLGLAGSVPGRYSLYRALEDEYEQARRPRG
jgi:hypothetical protein